MAQIYLSTFVCMGPEVVDLQVDLSPNYPLHNDFMQVKVDDDLGVCFILIYIFCSFSQGVSWSCDFSCFRARRSADGHRIILEPRNGSFWNPDHFGTQRKRKTLRDCSLTPVLRIILEHTCFGSASKASFASENERFSYETSSKK